jgi:cysteinyl-tRNA synthetase
VRLSTEGLHSSAEQVRRLRELAERVQRTSFAADDDPDFMRRIDEVRAGYRAALDDDLNLPLGIGLVFELVREANAALDAKRVSAAGLSSLTGLLQEVDAHLDVIRPDDRHGGLAQEVERLIAEREAARAARDFGRADQIREELRKLGIALEDSKDGVRWRRVPTA